MKMGAVCSYKTLLLTNMSTLHHNLKDHNTNCFTGIQILGMLLTCCKNSFQLVAPQCVTLVLQKNFMWNTVTVQYNSLIEEEWDEHFKVTCEYGYDFWKTVTFPFLDVE